MGNLGSRESHQPGCLMVWESSYQFSFLPLFHPQMLDLHCSMTALPAYFHSAPAPPPLFYMLRLLNFNSIWCLLPRGPEQTQIFVYDLFYLTLYMQDSSMSNSFIKKSNYIPIRLLKFYWHSKILLLTIVSFSSLWLNLLSQLPAYWNLSQFPHEGLIQPEVQLW